MSTMPDDFYQNQPEQPDPAQVVAAGLKSGTLRYTPQQKQQLSRNAAARAWLTGNNVPEHVRTRELSRLDKMDQQIQPLPVPPDEIPPTIEEHVRGSAWVDEDGVVSHPGTTWIRTSKGDLEVPRSLPNNQLEYVREMSAPPEHIVDPEQDFLARRGGGGPFGSFHAQKSADTLSAHAKANVAIVGLRDKQAQAMARDQQMRAKLEEQHRKTVAQERMDQQKEEERLAADRYKRLKDFEKQAQDRQKAKYKAENGSEVGFAPDYEAARQDAMDEEAEWQQTFSPEASKRHASYGNYLREKYAGVKSTELLGGDEERKSEYKRRNGATVSAPMDWRSSTRPPLPVAAMERLQSLTPAQLEDFRQHAMGRPLTEDEFEEEHPDKNYDQYLATYRWARESGRRGPLRVPGGIKENAESQKTPSASAGKRLGQQPQNVDTVSINPEITQTANSEPGQPGGMSASMIGPGVVSPNMIGRGGVYGPAPTEPAGSDQRIQRAINAARSGDAGAQQALAKRGIQWQQQ